MNRPDLDHLFLCASAIMMLEDEHLFSSFRFSELSQPTWSLLLVVPQLRKEQFMKKTMSVLLMGFMAWLELSGGFESYLRSHSFV